MRHGQSPEDRAKEIESVLDWVCNKPVGDFPGGDDVPLGQLNSVHMSQHSPEIQKYVVSDNSPDSFDGAKEQRQI